MSEPSKQSVSGCLYVVATPIGNLDDISARALKTLADADLIAAEDTRHTGRLLSHFGLKKSLFALHDHNEAEATKVLMSRLQAGQSIALVSDAGTPLVSDPGYRLCREAAAASIDICPIPGASAVLAALSVSGLPSDRFTFAGFVPSRQEAREKFLIALKPKTETQILFVSVHQIEATLTAMCGVFGGERQATVCRELTKRHESVYRGTLTELCAMHSAGRIVEKGEFVIVLAGAKDSEAQLDTDISQLLKPLLDVLPMKLAVKTVQAATGLPRNSIYDMALKLKSDLTE
ncbi:MAG: 16S rRNA (cytidine(1402)-2'-O)-methyltransferase [Pseudomonadota bacterium]